MTFMDSKELIRELESRAGQLESEAQRLRAAAQVLRGEVPVVATPTAPSPSQTSAPHQALGTMPLIIDTLAEIGPATNRDLTAALRKRGWVTVSTQPTNTVRTALGRLLRRGQVVQLDDGRFALPPATDETVGR